MTTPLFDGNASETLKEVSATFVQRGTEYGDTWRNAQWLNVKAAARLAGLELDTKTARLIAAASLADVKYQRMEGPYKRDTVIDRIAYDANLAAEVEAYLKSKDV